MRAWIVLCTICCLYVIITQHQASAGAGAKIIGGQPVIDATTYPFMAALSKKYRRRGQFYFICGAAIISDQWLLTAAHCVYSTKGKKGPSPSNFKVNVGSHDRSAATSRTLSEIIRHQQYTGNFEDDIALLKLTSPLTLTAGSNINSAPFARPTDKATNYNACTIMGWGKTGPNSGAEIIMRDAQTEALFDLDCEDELRKYGLDNLVNITCVRHASLPTGVCSGDSGGPLICGGKIYGVASFAASTCTPAAVSGFTDTTKYSDWITSKAN